MGAQDLGYIKATNFYLHLVLSSLSWFWFTLVSRYNSLWVQESAGLSIVFIWLLAAIARRGYSARITTDFGREKKCW